MTQALLTDSHCHLDRLDLSETEGGLDELLDNARGHGVGHFLCVGIDLENAAEVIRLAARYDNVFASVGVHPNEQGGAEPDEETLVRLADAPKVVAIGETGLDYYRTEARVDWQQERFRRHIRAARHARKPLVVHSREAATDTLRILEQEGAREVGGVMHCFVEDWETAKGAMEMGFFISFSGIITFKSADALREVARRVPDDFLLIETDSPYLAPVPYRGKPNQPAYVRFVAETLAALRGQTLERVAELTTGNFFRLIG